MQAEHKVSNMLADCCTFAVTIPVSHIATQSVLYSFPSLKSKASLVRTGSDATTMFFVKTVKRPSALGYNLVESGCHALCQFIIDYGVDRCIDGTNYMLSKERGKPFIDTKKHINTIAHAKCALKLVFIGRAYFIIGDHGG